jgi:hypothetical protein
VKISGWEKRKSSTIINEDICFSIYLLFILCFRPLCWADKDGEEDADIYPDLILAEEFCPKLSRATQAGFFEKLLKGAQA